MADDDQDGPWVTDWDEIDGIVDEEEWDDAPDRPRRAAPLAADRVDDGDGDGGGDGGDGGYDDYDDGDGRRRRGVVVALLALVLVLGGIVAAALLVSADDDDGDVDTIATSTSRPRPSTTTTKVTPTSIGALPGQTSTTAVGGGSSTTMKPTTSTTKPAVTTSTTEAPDGPACGTGTPGTAAPGNQALKMSGICIDDPTPKVGQTITINGTADDPDSQIEPDCIKVSWEGEEFGECFPKTVEQPQRGQEYTFKHAYTQPGTYTIHVGALSDHPKQSIGEVTYKITVHA